MSSAFVVPLKELRLVEPDALTMPAAHAWLGYWRELCERAPDGMARRADLDLIRDRPQLARLAVWIEVLTDDYRFILAGEDVRALFGRSIKDLKLSEIRFTGCAETTWRQYDAAVETRQPCCSIGRYYFSDASSYQVGGTRATREMAMLPFVNPDGAVDRLLAGMAFDTRQPRLSAFS
ncbi:hypothetical protein CKO28_05225 [Rhodovibrio sodomensis]|uniref:PAS domain-containing protein n=1 Tax=Rhodovibrio sodomensis TaxID=1088 RepID=A0ABS1DBY1_9PROT|nr:PAS domain-containing protein [Rhodovibrio sodomensis]MBK1667431.1 hypothetical protein [Rhodovibrio sodomensis]